MAYIKIKLDAALMDGHNVTFKAPCDCTAIEGLKVCYIENNSLQEKIFSMQDTHGNALAGLGNLFAAGAYVHAILDSVNLIAYLQNAATNGYLEGKLKAAEAAIAADHAAIEELVNNQIPEEYLQACVDDFISNNQSGLATKTDLEGLNSDLSNAIENSTNQLYSEIVDDRVITEMCFNNLDKEVQTINKYNPIIGGLTSANGSINTATNRITTEEIMVIDRKKPLFVEVDSNIMVRMIAWYEGDTFIKLESFTNGMTPLSAYCRLLFNRLDDSDMVLSDVTSAFIYQARDNTPVMNVISKNVFDIGNVYNGFLNSNNGALQSNDGYITSQFIDVSGFTKGIAINTRYRKFLAFDKDQKAITDTYIDAWTESGIIPLNENWGYIRVTFSSTSTYIQIEDNTEITDFEKFGYVLNADTMNEILLKVGKDNLVGLVGMSFGDSIMYGAGGGGTGILDILAEKYGIVSNDYSVSGASMQYVSSRPHIIAQIQNAITSGIIPNFILLDGLSNDVISSTLGELTDSFDFETKGHATFTDGMEYAIGLLKGAFPSVPIIYVLPHSTPAREYDKELQFGERAREICKKWSVPIADVYKNGNVNTRLQNQLEMYSNYPTETSGTHPNRNGYDYAYIPLIEEILNRLF